MTDPTTDSMAPLKPALRTRWCRRHDLAAACIALLLILFWEVMGGDRFVTGLLASAETGFPLRAHPVLVKGLHEGGRLASAIVLVGLMINAIRRPVDGPTRRARWFAIGVVVVCMVLVSAIKRVSLTSCPWDVALFGGQYPYVPHWPWMGTDGGPGHCFPSGHASAAFAYFALVFLWRPHAPQRAHWIAAAVLATGALLGLTQVLRGAHYVSHVFWTAWICWTVSALAMARYHARHTRRHHGRSADNRPQEHRTP